MFRKMNGSKLGSRETMADIWVYNSLSALCGFKLRFGGETKGLTYFGFPVLKGLRVYLECIHLRFACSM